MKLTKDVTVKFQISPIRARALLYIGFSKCKHLKILQNILFKITCLLSRLTWNCHLKPFKEGSARVIHIFESTEVSSHNSFCKLKKIGENFREND